MFQPRRIPEETQEFYESWPAHSTVEEAKKLLEYKESPERPVCVCAFVCCQVKLPIVLRKVPAKSGKSKITRNTRHHETSLYSVTASTACAALPLSKEDGCRPNFPRIDDNLHKLTSTNKNPGQWKTKENRDMENPKLQSHAKCKQVTFARFRWIFARTFTKRRDSAWAVQMASLMHHSLVRLVTCSAAMQACEGCKTSKVLGAADHFHCFCVKISY